MLLLVGIVCVLAFGLLVFICLGSDFEVVPFLPSPFDVEVGSAAGPQPWEEVCSAAARSWDWANQESDRRAIWAGCGEEEEDPGRWERDEDCSAYSHVPTVQGTPSLAAPVEL